MAARTADPAFFPAVSVPLTNPENLAASHPPSDLMENPIGAFRGLGFAIVLEVLFVIIGTGLWEIVRGLF